MNDAGIKTMWVPNTETSMSSSAKRRIEMVIGDARLSFGLSHWLPRRRTFPASSSRWRWPNAVERAYRRGNLLEKRRALMDAWARYCEPRSAEVLKIEDRLSAA
jgi:hypothetical protein